MSAMRTSFLALTISGFLAGSGATLAQDAVSQGGEAPESNAGSAAEESGQEASGPRGPNNPQKMEDLTMESSGEVRQAICGLVQTAADELTAEMPIRIDDATTMVRADTVYLNGICTYNLSYEVDEANLLDRLQGILSDVQGEDMPMDSVRQFYQTGGPGYPMMKDGLRDTMLGDEAFGRVASIPFVEVRANFKMQGDAMEDFELLMGRHEQTQDEASE